MDNTIHFLKSRDSFDNIIISMGGAVKGNSFSPNPHIKVNRVLISTVMNGDSDLGDILNEALKPNTHILISGINELTLIPNIGRGHKLGLLERLNPYISNSCILFVVEGNLFRASEVM